MINKYDLAIQRKKEIVAKYGGKNLSEMLNISHPAVSKWEVIPQLRAYQIASFGDYKLEYIRQDLASTHYGNGEIHIEYRENHYSEWQKIYSNYWNNIIS